MSMQVIDDAYYEALLREGWRRCAMGQPPSWR